VTWLAQLKRDGDATRIQARRTAVMVCLGVGWLSIPFEGIAGAVQTGCRDPSDECSAAWLRTPKVVASSVSGNYSDAAT